MPFVGNNMCAFYALLGLRTVFRTFYQFMHHMSCLTAEHLLITAHGGTRELTPATALLLACVLTTVPLWASVLFKRWRKRCNGPVVDTIHSWVDWGGL